ncbi:hypothetical protein D7030_11095 [Flavobacteriaceae bacterium AU392]|nr:hypothetical protein D1817_13575 [Flavobacteriaceae bacterium]RKM82706.1 hypothetical protein D7030_11095 [Flavobacteriaceae bacterium AU392]
MTTKQTNKVKGGFLLILITIMLACSSSSEKKNVIPDTDAIYEGENDMGWVISHYMIYPKSEENVNRAGIVNVSWTVNKSGAVENVKTSMRKTNKPANTAIARRLIPDKEVLEINKPIIDNLVYSIKLLKFIPAKKNGKPVNSELSTSVEFILIP